VKTTEVLLTIQILASQGGPTQARRTWRPGDGPLPQHFEQAAWRLYTAAGHAEYSDASWADLPSSVRDAYRRRVMDRLEDWTLTSAAADLELVFAWLLAGLRPVEPEILAALRAIADDALGDVAAVDVVARTAAGGQ
jgi:hypothetical protein